MLRGIKSMTYFIKGARSSPIYFLLSFMSNNVLVGRTICIAFGALGDLQSAGVCLDEREDF